MPVLEEMAWRVVTRVSTYDRDDLKALFAEYAGARHGGIRDELVRAHLGLAEHLAWRFANRGEPLDDLIQVANLGLCMAVERFDPDRGLEFKTFATPTIIGELKRHFRDKTWAIRVPRRLQELHLEMNALIGTFSQEYGRSPTVAEIGRELGASDEEVLEALEAGQSYRSASLDQPGEEDGEELANRLGRVDPSFDNAELWASLSDVVKSLPERERRILYLRFFRGEMQSEIARQLGISQMHVSRLLSRILDRLRGAVGPHEGPRPLPAGPEPGGDPLSRAPAGSDL
jgi:RNA polymerase sigma-B factor